MTARSPPRSAPSSPNRTAPRCVAGSASSRRRTFLEARSRSRFAGRASSRKGVRYRARQDAPAFRDGTGPASGGRSQGDRAPLGRPSVDRTPTSRRRRDRGRTRRHDRPASPGWPLRRRGLGGRQAVATSCRRVIQPRARAATAPRMRPPRTSDAQWSPVARWPQAHALKAAAASTAAAVPLLVPKVATRARAGCRSSANTSAATRAAFPLGNV